MDDRYFSTMVETIKQEPVDYAHEFFRSVTVTSLDEKSPKKSKTKKQGQLKITECFKAEKKKTSRFDGFSEEELYKRCLPDHLAPNLDILIIGINPGLFAAYKGHHYAGPGNHFWKCLFLSGLIPEPMTANDDYKLIQYGIGFTNIVQRTTRGSADLKPQEIKEGAKILLDKIRSYNPRIAVFNGKEIYRVFSGQKEFGFGKQPHYVDGTGTLIYVMPSSSARCSQLPRAIDKVPFYLALKKLRDHLRGDLPFLTDDEITFSSVLVTAPRKNGGGTIKNELVTDDTDDLKRPLDKNGRPRLHGRQEFDLSLVKNEPVDDDGAEEENEERMQSTSMAKQNVMQLIKNEPPERCPSTPTDLSEFFIDPLPTALPQRPSHNGTANTVYAVNGLIYCPATTSSHEHNGDQDNQQQGQANEQQSGTSQQTSAVETNGGHPTGTEQTVQQTGSLNQVHTTTAAQSVYQEPNSTIVYMQAQQSAVHPVQQQQINGENIPVSVSTQRLNGGGQSLPVAEAPAPVNAQPATGRPSGASSLPADVAQHVEEAIETVVQRARAGPLEMPAFRTQAEKNAAAHAHQHQHQQQQMFASLQMQAATLAAAQAAQFDLGRMKAAAAAAATASDPILTGYPGGGGGTTASAEQNPNTGGGQAALYQYFQQQQQQQQVNQGGFSGGAQGGNTTTGAFGPPTGPNYAWPAATAAANQTAAGGANLYNQYFQNAAAFSPAGINQQLYNAAAAGAQTGVFPPGTYFQPQQQQSAAAMYGQYASGFVTGMQQQQHQHQQQSPHNL